jgi:CDGSH-type Zn-finger protein
MARIVVKTAKGPHVVKVGDKELHICMCGLSKNQPFCDGSHKKTLDEKEDGLYQYDEKGERMKDEEGCCGGGCCGGKCEEEHHE